MFSPFNTHFVLEHKLFSLIFRGVCVFPWLVVTFRDTHCTGGALSNLIPFWVLRVILRYPVRLEIELELEHNLFNNIYIIEYIYIYIYIIYNWIPYYDT